MSLEFPLLWQFLEFLCFLWPWELFGVVFCKDVPLFEFLYCFSQIRLGLCVLERKPTQAKFHFHHMLFRIHTINRLITIEVDLDFMVEVAFVRFLHYKVPSPPPFYTILLWVTMQSVHLRARNLCIPSVRARVSTLFGILHRIMSIYVIWNSTQNNSIFSPINFLFTHFFITVWTQIYLFCTTFLLF